MTRLVRSAVSVSLVGTLVAVFSVGWAAAPQLRAQSQAATLRQFKLAFRTSQETVATAAAKRSALTALGSFDSPPVARVLIQAYGTLEREAGPLESRRRELLLRGGGSKILAPLRDKLQPIHNLQGELIAALDGIEDPRAISELVGAFLKPRRRHPFALRLALSRRAGDLAEADLGLVTKAKKKRGAEDRVLLCRALGSLGRRGAGSVDWVVSQLQHQSIDVRVAAVRALGGLAAASSLAPLIECLDAERGRTRDLVEATLQRLTGANPGPASQSWRMWLADVGQVFVRGEKPLSVHVAAAPSPAKAGRKQQGRRQGRGKPRGTGSYFGIPQDGEAILYVFDNSQSMRVKMPGRGGETRMQRCKTELHKALKALKPNKTFNLLCFANRLRRFADKMQPATPENLARAHAWVDGIKMEFETNTYDSLEQAFQIAGRGTVDRHYPVVADTMFFLSDGAPTRKRVGVRGLGGDSVAEILAAVRRWNPLGRVVIHSIGLGIRGAGRAGAFLRQLAQQNGGQFARPK